MVRRTATNPTPIDPDAAALSGMDTMPADPAPAKRGPGRPKGTGSISGPRKPNGTIMSKADMTAAVRGQIMMLVLPVAAAWELRDEECASVLTEEVTPRGDSRIEAIIDQIMVMIGRHAGVLEFMAKNTLLVDMGMMATLLLPIVKKVWKHHGPNGAGHGAQEQERADEFNRYAPYSPAARAAFAG